MKDNNLIEKLNGRLIAFFIFQYSLFIPVMAYVPPVMVMVVTGVAILAIAFFNNIKYVANVRIILLYIAMLFIFCIKVLVMEHSSAQFIATFMVYSVPPAIVMLYKFNIDTFFETSFKLSYVNFLINFLGPIMPGFAYMRFGYGLIVSTVFIFVEFSYYRLRMSAFHRVVCLITLIVSFIEVFLFGARGSMIVFLTFVIINMFIEKKGRVVKNMVIFIGACVVYLNLTVILRAFLKLSQMTGIYSYSLTKFIMQIENGWEYASSGRDILYAEALEKIKAHPIIGNPIRPRIEGETYAHNIFLQVGLDFGMIGLIILIFFIVIVLYIIMIGKYEKKDKIALAILFSLSFGRLMFSSTLWERPEFWLLVCYTIILKSKKNKTGFCDEGGEWDQKQRNC